MDQFDAIAVDHAQQSGLSQKVQCPIPMGGKQAEEPRPFGQFWKQRTIIPLQPAIECPTATAFQRKQYTYGDYFTGLQQRLGVFGNVFHLVINPAEKLGDKINCGHEVSPFAVGLVTFSIESLVTFFN
jgi:hypothetical protein